MKRLQEILDSFNQPFTDYISKKPVFSKGKKSGDVSFIPWPNLCEILDQLAPGWEWEIKSCDYHGDRTIVIGRLTINGSDGSLSREATGNEDSQCDGYGDPSSNAEAMAMRRCCAKFGVGRYLWFKNHVTNGKGTISKEEYQRKFGRKEENILTN